MHNGNGVFEKAIPFTDFPVDEIELRFTKQHDLPAERAPALGGGFGSYSRLYGTAAASLLEAEIVTADGAVRITNAATNPDLFWALKGGGGGTFGVVTRLHLENTRAAGDGRFCRTRPATPTFRQPPP